MAQLRTLGLLLSRLRPSSFIPATALLFVVALSPGTARAQADIGVRAGVSGDPDQFYVGAHIDTQPIVDRLRFRPNVEVGFGNDVTLVAVNLEFAYVVPIRRHPWSVYFGGGPAINFYRGEGNHPGDSSTEPGFNLLVGLAHTGGLFAELKVGALDSPGVKFGVGYTFK
jgi:hypothetical protein